MSQSTNNVHSGVKQYGIHIARLVEDVGLSIILVATLFASGIEINHMWEQRNVMLEDLLLMFIYVETVTMVKVYWESGKLPVRMPLYIAIVAVARYLIIDIKDMESLRAIAVSSPSQSCWFAGVTSSCSIQSQEKPREMSSSGTLALAIRSPPD